jgi:hypothetical protein
MGWQNRISTRMAGGKIVFKLHDCSEAGLKLIEDYVVKKDKPFRPALRTGIETPFPFKAMNIGQSFFLFKNDLSYYLDYLVKKRVRDYNRRYKTEFAIIKHSDKLEIVRIG